MRPSSWIFNLLLFTGPLLAELPLVIPCASCDTQLIWVSDLSILAWRAEEEGLWYAQQENRLVNIDFDWEPAFKANIGFIFPSRGWDLNLRWTWFNTHTEHSASSVLPIWILPPANTLYNQAMGSWRLNFNALDLTLGFSPSLSPDLTVRFEGGLKGMTIQQHLKTRYANPLSLSTASMKNKTIGVGPRIGCDSKWGFGVGGCSFIGQMAASLPLTHIRVSRKDHGALQLFYTQRVWFFRPVLETALGFGWERCLGNLSIGLKALYELQYFWEQNLMGLLVNETLLYQPFLPKGDLFLQGASFTIHLGY